MTKVVQLKPQPSQKDMLDSFAIAYAENGGDHIRAYIEAGFSEKTAPQNAKKYLDRNYKYVMATVQKQMGLKASKIGRLLDRYAEDETIPINSRIKIWELMLRNSNIQKDTLVIEDGKADELTPEQRQAEIDSLMKKFKASNA